MAEVVEHDGMKTRAAGVLDVADAEASNGATVKSPAPRSSAAPRAVDRARALVNICLVCGSHLGIYKVRNLSVRALSQPVRTRLRGGGDGRTADPNNRG